MSFKPEVHELKLVGMVPGSAVAIISDRQAQGSPASILDSGYANEDGVFDTSYYANLPGPRSVIIRVISLGTQFLEYKINVPTEPIIRIFQSYEHNYVSA